MEKHSVDFAYWPLNVGMKPTHEPSADTSNEGYGLLTNDWEPRWHDERLRLLRNMIPVQVSRHAPYSLTSSLSPPTYIDTRIPLVLLASPWCYPLPGPLTDWDNCSIPHVTPFFLLFALLLLFLCHSSRMYILNFIVTG